MHLPDSTEQLQGGSTFAFDQCVNTRDLSEAGSPPPGAGQGVRAGTFASSAVPGLDWQGRSVTILQKPAMLFISINVTGFGT